MKKLLVMTLAVLLISPAFAFASDTGEQVYNKSCAACHGSGVMGAPKLGDKEDWKPRIAEGMDKMYNSALHGDGAMPAKGGNPSLSDDEVKAAVDYMVDKAK